LQFVAGKCSVSAPKTKKAVTTLAITAAISKLHALDTLRAFSWQKFNDILKKFAQVSA